MSDLIRVRWKGLKPIRESSIPEHRFDDDLHSRLDKPAVDRNGEVLPPKFEALPASRKTATAAAPETGQSADTKKES